MIGVFLLVGIGMAGVYHFSRSSPTSNNQPQNRRPEQNTLCESLVKQKLLHPETYQRVGNFSEISDSQSQRIFSWTFTSRTAKGGVGTGTAMCTASNYFDMANINVEQLK